jgi:hypothetical protein
MVPASTTAKSTEIPERSLLLEVMGIPANKSRLKYQKGY